MKVGFALQTLCQVYWSFCSEEWEGERMPEVTSSEDKTLQAPPPPPPHSHGKHTSFTHLLSLLLCLSTDCEMINSREL